MGKNHKKFTEVEAFEIFPPTQGKLSLPPPKESLRGFVFILVVLGVVFFFVVKIAIFDHEYFLHASEQNFQKVILNPSQRGTIYSKDGAVFAKSQPAFDVRLDLRQIFSSESSTRDTLSFLYEQGLYGEIVESLQMLNEQSTEIIIKDIHREAALAIIASHDRYPGLTVFNSFTRIYPRGSITSAITGYLGKISKEEYERLSGYRLDDIIGRSGTEESYEQFLRGEPHKEIIERDAVGRILKTKVENEGKVGYDIILSIDDRLQTVIYQAMKEAFYARGFQKGTAVALNPQTGEVLALVSLPDFDSNTFINGQWWQVARVLQNVDEPLFNRAVSGLYNPGSTIKPLLALAALEEKIIDPQKKILSNGFITIPNPYDPEKVSIFRDWRVHGWVNLKEAIARSVNVYFYSIGGGYEDQKGLGITKIKEYFDKFLLNQKLGIDFPGESSGFVPSPAWKEKASPRDPLWRVGDTYNISIGQGALVVTPIQIASWTAMIANNGRIMQPFFVSEMRDSSGKIIFKREPTVLAHDIVSQQNLKLVKEGMRMTVTEGTGVLLSDLPVAVAGKSGSAQISGTERLNAIFTSFFPYNNPRIVLTVLVENVKEGSVVAIPIVKEIIKRYYGF